MLKALRAAIGRPLLRFRLFLDLRKLRIGDIAQLFFIHHIVNDRHHKKRERRCIDKATNAHNRDRLHDFRSGPHAKRHYDKA